jgi:membrane-associated protein
VAFLSDLLTGRYSLDDLIRWGGYAVLFAIVFVETGLLVGFFLPGDSLLTTGLVAAAGGLNLWWLNVLLIVAAVVGDAVGYTMGARLGSSAPSRRW